MDASCPGSKHNVLHLLTLVAQAQVRTEVLDRVLSRPGPDTCLGRKINLSRPPVNAVVPCHVLYSATVDGLQLHDINGKSGQAGQAKKKKKKKNPRRTVRVRLLRGIGGALVWVLRRLTLGKFTVPVFRSCRIFYTGRFSPFLWCVVLAL